MIQENIDRHQLTNITAKLADATVMDDTSVGQADILIADLPCSGLGILRKKTDIKYRMSSKQQMELVALQRSILDTVHAYVKPGGTLIYSTCTIHRGENEDNVAWFVDKYPQFQVIETKQMFPEETLGDGFFIAKLVRMES